MISIILNLKCDILGMEGDPCYLAPEVLSGRYSKACDVFSLGVSILELATDMELPRSGQLWHDLRNKGPDPNLHMQPELRRVVQLMMTKDPDRRPCIKQLLELPCIVKAVRRRERHLMLSKAKQTGNSILKAVLLPFLNLIHIILVFVLVPLKKFALKYHHPVTPPPNPSIATKICGSDYFSDDELDCSVNSFSSLAAPLQSSDSSDNSFLHGLTEEASCDKSSFFNDDSSPVKRPMSSPGLRSRGKIMSRTPGAIGFTPSKRLFFDEIEKVNTSRGDSLESGVQSVDGEESDVELVTMKPQSLAATFDCFSDED